MPVFIVKVFIPIMTVANESSVRMANIERTAHHTGMFNDSVIVAKYVTGNYK